MQAIGLVRIAVKLVMQASDLVRITKNRKVGIIIMHRPIGKLITLKVSVFKWCKFDSRCPTAV